MTENIKKFMELVSCDEQNLAKFNEINQKHQEIEDNKIALIKFAGTLGITLTEEDFAEEMKEISDDELDSVSGGATIESDHMYKKVLISDCWCVVGGGGTADKYQNTCACVLGGVGTLTSAGENEKYDGRYRSASGGVAMWCAVGGSGFETYRL